MLVRGVLQTIVLGMVFIIGTHTAQATVWDAYSQYNTTSNSATDVWQYLTVSEGANSGYSLMGTYGYCGFAASTGWQDATSVPFIGKSANYTNGLYVLPGETTEAAVIGWKSPLTGTVNVDYSFSITKLVEGEITYALYREGDEVGLPLESGTRTTSSGTIEGTVSIAYGKMLYLQLGPSYAGGGNDFWYDDSVVTFTVSGIPEPSSLMLMASGIIGLLAYAWRKHK